MSGAGTSPSRFRCAGCGRAPDETLEPPFACPWARPGDDVDHVLVREDALAGVAWPQPGEPNPFLRFGPLLHVRRFAVAGGLGGAAVDAIVRELDAAVAAVDGAGFRHAPCAPNAALARALGFDSPEAVTVWDATGDVAGSQKARHLLPVLVMLEVRRRLGLRPDLTEAPLAIASCGNAALAAAVLAKAARRTLRVFVPADADPDTLERLRALGATIEPCPRADDAPGDPCIAPFRDAVAAGAVPFSCQGPANGLVIDGGRTIGWELAGAVAGAGVTLDRVLVPVGGGALASAVVAGLRDALRLGVLARLPRIHPVQTDGGWPLARAHEAVVARMRATGEAHDVVLRWAARHRSAFMWPWETPPHSLATGILDDETWDWRAVVDGTLASGGAPVVVDDDDLRRARALAEEALPRAASYTGAAALAALAKLRDAGAVAPEERVAVLVTGVRRGRGG